MTNWRAEVPWSADLPELPDERAVRAVLAVLLDVLVYRDVTRDDVRTAYAAAIAAASDPASLDPWDGLWAGEGSN